MLHGMNGLVPINLHVDASTSQSVTSLHVDAGKMARMPPTPTKNSQQRLKPTFRVLVPANQAANLTDVCVCVCVCASQVQVLDVMSSLFSQ
mmetsp:Transcript_5032/g.13706  ORF Transcript_5032/g.13706 Transcript_5032/m.13706 type:complete len:91 (-) Transcript_5032:109-381(-)